MSDSQGSREKKGSKPEKEPKQKKKSSQAGSKKSSGKSKSAEEESESSDDEGDSEEEESNSPIDIIHKSQYSSGYVDPQSGFGIYRDSSFLETHSMVDYRNSGTFQMSGFGNKAKSGFETSRLNVGGSGF
jgi:cobalamin biosynthesis protein CobT